MSKPSMIESQGANQNSELNQLEAADVAGCAPGATLKLRPEAASHVVFRTDAAAHVVFRPEAAAHMWFGPK